MPKAQVLPVCEGLYQQAEDGIQFFLGQAYIALSQILNKENAQREMEACIDQAKSIHTILIHQGPAAAIDELKHMEVPPFRSYQG